jgi:hypothetical protein
VLVVAPSVAVAAPVARGTRCDARHLDKLSLRHRNEHAGVTAVPLDVANLQAVPVVMSVDVSAAVLVALIPVVLAD